MNRTLYDKLWDAHTIRSEADGTTLLYIDRHLVHEVTSPQAFEALRTAGRHVWRPSSIVATPDHNVSTQPGRGDTLPSSAEDQLSTLKTNCEEQQITLFGLKDPRQGIVHVIGPEQGLSMPGSTIVCGDSHTSTHGAFGALAFGIGTSQVQHALATQTLSMRKSLNMLVRLDGKLNRGVYAKDIALYLIGRIGTDGATGHAIEFAGPLVETLSMEARMTLCNMAIEAGARSGLVGVDDKTIQYLEGRPYAPRRADWDAAVTTWREFRTDPDAHFDRVISMDATQIEPQVSWGTSPDMVSAITGCVPDPREIGDPSRRSAIERALAYMQLEPLTPITDIRPDTVFIGSCTNSRIEDLRSAAAHLHGRRIAANIQRALVVPGSGLVKAQAEQEGLDAIFKQAGFEWREAGCSMCLGMNDDRLEAGQRCASTSNRNFEGRQGAGGRTHLVSPAMAAAAAVAGHFVNIQS